MVIPRVSYQGAPSDLRRYVRHDAVERHYGSARQEEADEENARLDGESDEEYGHNLSSDHDGDYGEEEEEEEYLVVDEGTEQEQGETKEHVDNWEKGNLEGQREVQAQPQQQPQKRPSWIRKLRSPPGEIIVVDSSPEVGQDEQQHQPSPTLQLRRTKAYKHTRRTDPFSEVIVVDSSSSSPSGHGQDVEMEDEPQPQRKQMANPKSEKAPAKRVEVAEDEYDMKDVPQPQPRKKATAKKRAPPKRIEVVEEYDMEGTGEKPKSKPRKKALVLKAGFSYEEEDVDEVPPTPKRKGGWPKGKKRGPSLPILAEVEVECDMEDVEKGPNPKPRKKALVSKVGFSYEEEDVEEKPSPKAGKKALVSRTGYTYEEENIYEVPPTPQRKGGWPKGKKRGPSFQSQTGLDAEIDDEVAELQGRVKAKPKSRKKTASKSVVDEADSHDEMVEPQPKSKAKPKPRKKAPVAKAKAESEDDEGDEPQRKMAPRRKARKFDTPDFIVVDSTFEDGGELVDESTKRLGYLKLPESEESEGYTTRKPKSRAGASTHGRGGGTAARGRGNLTGKAARTTLSRQTAMLKKRGPSILEEEMARHGVKEKREDDELMMP